LDTQLVKIIQERDATEWIWSLQVQECQPLIGSAQEHLGRAEAHRCTCLDGRNRKGYGSKAPTRLFPFLRLGFFHEATFRDILNLNPALLCDPRLELKLYATVYGPIYCLGHSPSSVPYILRYVSIISPHYTIIRGFHLSADPTFIIVGVSRIYTNNSTALVKTGLWQMTRGVRALGYFLHMGTYSETSGALLSGALIFARRMTRQSQITCLSHG